MYYSDLVKKACAIMYDAHKEDVDRGGYPYVLHPFYLATQMDDEESTCAALLHDVIEDHGDRYSFDDLVRAGFPDSVIHALRLLTHESGVLYMDYVKALAKDPIARKVKLAELGSPAVKRHAGRKIRAVSTGDPLFGCGKPPHTGITSADFEIFSPPARKAYCIYGKSMLS